MATSLALLDDSSDGESDGELKINENYAQRYNRWRNAEELQKLKNLSKEISSESSESEEEVEPVIEEDFLKTLSLLKAKDPVIYDGSTTFFSEDTLEKPKTKTKNAKPMFMKDYERKLILERNGEASSDEETATNKPQTLAEEMEESRKEFVKASNANEGSSSSESDEEQDFLQVRKKSKAEEEKEEENYMHWLKGQKSAINKEKAKSMKFLRKFWNDPKLDGDEKFLRDYILNKQYAEDGNSEIPTYDEITAEEFHKLNADEEELERQETFEHKYNYRFEEPDDEFIKRYPRTVGDSLRRVNNKRKEKREEYTDRKQREKESKREELKRLKALKRKEIEEKFFRIKEVSGRENLNFDEDDMDEDFDPEKHDQKMKELFNDDYYTVEEIQKPEFEYDEELDNDNWDRWIRDKDSAGTSQTNEDEKEFVDEDTNENDNIKSSKQLFEKEMIDSTQGRKKSKKKSMFAKMMSQPKPLYDKSGKSFDTYLDEYYTLDCEDVVGDLPVRFKYRKVIPNDFGLSVDEIFCAHDKELNKWCSIKKAFQYRRDDEEVYDVQAYKKRADNLGLKHKVLTSCYSLPAEENGDEANKSEVSNSSTGNSKKRRKKKKNSDLVVADNLNTDVPISHHISKKAKFEPENVAENFAEREDKSLEDQNQNLVSAERASDKLRNEAEIHSKKKKKKKKKKHNTEEDLKNFDEGIAQETATHTFNLPGYSTEDSLHSSKKKHRNRKHRAGSSFEDKHGQKYIANKKMKTADVNADKRLALSDDRLAAYGINPKKFKNKIKYGHFK